MNKIKFNIWCRKNTVFIASFPSSVYALFLLLFDKATSSVQHIWNTNHNWIWNANVCRRKCHSAMTPCAKIFIDIWQTKELVLPRQYCFGTNDICYNSFIQTGRQTDKKTDWHTNEQEFDFIAFSKRNTLRKGIRIPEPDAWFGLNLLKRITLIGWT